MQDFGLSFAMCVHGSLSKERLGEVLTCKHYSSFQLRRGLVDDFLRRWRIDCYRKFPLGYGPVTVDHLTKIRSNLSRRDINHLDFLWINTRPKSANF